MHEHDICPLFLNPTWSGSHPTLKDVSNLQNGGNFLEPERGGLRSRDLSPLFDKVFDKVAVDSREALVAVLKSILFTAENGGCGMSTIDLMSEQ
jgi:hypothetical protein